ncbi:MAG TPA: ABC transporter substrate-binding protein [Candidatus Methylomirabilis sp.]|nr:ABC transporter substrate-binding protein [Candidatus Methylomirabilis sp.]
MSRTIRALLFAAALPMLVIAPMRVRPISAAGRITIATSAEPNSGDFHQSVGTIGRQLAVNIGDALVALDENLQVQPALAQSWKQESPTSWVFVLRRGVKFHDGTPFNAAAVKFNFERLLDPATKSRDANMLAALDTVEVIDDSTVRLKLKRPFAPLVRTLAYILGYMVSPTAAKAAGLQDFGRAPVATGPFKLAQWVSGDHITLIANKDYWRGAPKIDEITWKFVPQSATRSALLRSGDVDFVESLDGPDLASVEGDPKLVVTRIPLLSWNFVGVNNRTKPFDNVKVRRAISHAIDANVLVRRVLLGAGLPQNQLVPKGMLGYREDYKGYAYDPALARRLLADAGYPNGFDTELWYATGYTSSVKELSEAIQGYLGAVGIRARIVVNDLGAWSAARREGRMPMMFMNWGSGTGDSDTSLYSPFDSKEAPPKGANYTFYANPKVDELVTRAREVSEAQRDALYREAVALIMDDAPWTMINQLVYLEVRNRSVENVGHQAGFLMYFGAATKK